MTQKEENASEIIDPNTWRKLWTVRVDLWTGSVGGLVIGGVIGKALHDIAQYFSKNKKQFNKNTMVLSIFASAATCSYLGSVVSGKQSLTNAMFLSGPIMAPKLPSVQDDLNPKISSYQAKVLENQQELVRNFDASFQRRAEAIRKMKEDTQDNRGQ